jgi:hypothetical protein
MIPDDHFSDQQFNRQDDIQILGAPLSLAFTWWLSEALTSTTGRLKMPKAVFDLWFPAEHLQELRKIQKQTEHPFLISDTGQARPIDDKTQAYRPVTLEFDLESIPSVKRALDFVAKNFEWLPEEKTFLAKPLQPTSD